MPFRESTPTFWSFTSTPSPPAPSTRMTSSFENAAVPVAPAPWLWSCPWVASPSRAA